jgi:hypothetical protein
MLDNLTPLTMSEIEILKKDFEVLTFPHDFNLVYEGQIPCAGVTLLEGQIEILKASKIITIIDAPNLLGINQLLSGIPVKYGCCVKANSKIILLGKSDLLHFKTKASLEHFLTK